MTYIGTLPKLRKILRILSNKWSFLKIINRLKHVFNPNLGGREGGEGASISSNSNGGISDFRISHQSLIKGNCHNSRTRDDIGMKLGSVTKLDKRNKTTPNKLTITLCRKIVTSLQFFQFTINSEQSRSGIPDAYSVKLIFSLIVTFHLTKTKNRTK